MSQIRDIWHVVLKYPELVSILKMKTMKTLNYEKTKDIFAEFVLSNDELIKVRGGDGEGEPIILPSLPPVKIW